MSQLTLTDLQTQVKDYVNGASLARVGRAANLVLRQIHRKFSPIERSTITTTQDVTAGTISVTQGATGVTGVGTSFNSAMIGGMIRITGSTAWFTILSTPTTTSLTLSSAWAAATVSGGTYTIVFPFLVFPTTVEEVCRIWEPNKTPLRFASDEYRQEVELATMSTPSYPQWFIPTRMDTTAGADTLRYQLAPAPDIRYVLEYSYKRRKVYYTITDGATTSDLPSIYDDALLYGTLWQVWDQEDKQDRSSYWYGMYQTALRDIMAASANPASMQFPEAMPLGGMQTYENRPIS